MTSQSKSYHGMLRFLIIISLTLISTIVPTTAIAMHGGKSVVVSLGDSYSSGEGCPPFYGQESEDKRSNEDWLAHRSELSWPGQLRAGGSELREYKDSLWLLLASSGAVSAEIYDESQRKPVDGVQPDPLLLAQLPAAAAQLEKNGMHPKEVDYVTLTIGGNDIGFADIIKDVYIATSEINKSFTHHRIEEAWNAYHSGLDEKIMQAYVMIRSYFPNADIIVAGYPRLLSSRASRYAGKCGSLGFTDSDVIEINSNCDSFNEELQSLVMKSGVNNITFVPVADQFGENGAYAVKALINKVMTPSRPEDLKRGLASAYSMHPNACGKSYTECNGENCGTHAYVKAVQPVLDSRMEDDVALYFISTWYGDWRYDGIDIKVEKPSSHIKALNYIDENSELYDTFLSRETSLRPQLEGASCIVNGPYYEEVSERENGENTFRITVEYVIAEGMVTGKDYEGLLGSINTDTWDVTVNSSGKVTALEAVNFDEINFAIADKEDGFVPKYNLHDLISEGGSGYLEEVFVPPTLKEFRQFYGADAQVDELGKVFITHQAHIPNSELSVLYSGSAYDEDNAEACGICGPLYALVKGLDKDDDLEISVYEFASNFRATPEGIDVMELLPPHYQEQADNHYGLCFVLYGDRLNYADGNDYARELRFMIDDGGTITPSTEVWMTAMTGVYM